MLKHTVTSRTNVCGIIGDPVGHSLSPDMHNAAFIHLGIDYIYMPFNVKKTELKQAIEGMRALNIKGLNVTMPHKVTVMATLNTLDATAASIGAVNTIVNSCGVLKGYNTDATGFLRVLRKHGINPKDKKAVVLGAGGVSRAISFALVEKGADLTILNRTGDRARQIADELSEHFGKAVVALSLNKHNLLNAMEKAELLVNATSVGTATEAEKTLVTSDMLHRHLIVFDSIYNPVKTNLLKEAEKAGARAISGLELLVYQGAMAFELWTGLKAPVAIMRKNALEALDRHEK